MSHNVHGLYQYGFFSSEVISDEYLNVHVSSMKWHDTGIWEWHGIEADICVHEVCS